MKEKLSSNYIFYLTVTIVLPTLILSAAASLVKDSKQMGWLSVIISGLAIGLLQYIILKLSFKFSNKNIIDDCKVLLGPILSNIIILLYLAVIINGSGVILLEIINYIHFVMPGISYGASCILTSLLGCYLAYVGIEVIAKVNKLGLILLIISIITIVIYISFNQTLMNFNNLYPIQINIQSLIKGSLIPSTWFILIPGLLLMLKPYCNNKIQFIKSSLLGNLFVQIVIIILFVSSVGSLGVDLTAKATYPFYKMTKLVIRGFEILIFFVWIIGAIIKLGIFYFASIKAISDWLVINNYKLLIIPFGVFISAISLYQYNNFILENILGLVVMAELLLAYIPIMVLLIILYLYKLYIVE